MLYIELLNEARYCTSKFGEITDSVPSNVEVFKVKSVSNYERCGHLCSDLDKCDGFYIEYVTTISDHNKKTKCFLGRLIDHDGGTNFRATRFCIKRNYM